MAEIFYKLDYIPDLSLKKYSSLEESGVDGVLNKHVEFLRQWNRKGLLSGVSIHLFYFYDGKDNSGSYRKGENGNKLKVLFMIKGDESGLRNTAQLVEASNLSEYFHFEKTTFNSFAEENNLKDVSFSNCSTLVKKELFSRSSVDAFEEQGKYYRVPKWEINEGGRLYSMFNLMEALDKQMLYRIDLYPVDESNGIKEALRRPTAILRERQYSRAATSGSRDYEAENVLREYDDLLDAIETTPHFLTNIFVFSHNREDSTVVIDSAGAEAVSKGNYEIANFSDAFSLEGMLVGDQKEYSDSRKKITARKLNRGWVVASEEAPQNRLQLLPVIFTLDEVAPFFRLPTLYDGESLQIRKETNLKLQATTEDGLYLGKDENGYDVFFPLELIKKHAFIAGVPGSGKTNTMHHITSSLWKKGIPFLVLEPAKQEYRALANQKGMEGLHIFAPNAGTRFPLHINPFEFPHNLRLSEHIRRLESVFEGAFPMEPPAPFLLDAAIEKVYRAKGWLPDTLNTGTLEYPTLSELYDAFEEVLNETDYGDEVRGNMKSILQVRIGSLIRREMGDVFNVSESTIPPDKWIDIPAVVELEPLGSGPANFMTLMLCALIRETLKVKALEDEEDRQYETSTEGNKKPVKHVILIEEAHNLIGPDSEDVTGSEANPKQAATNFIVKMLAEVRALNEGIIIADQLPTVMADEVIKNTGLKIGLRITSSDDRALLCSTMAANQMQMEQMATFNVGQALVTFEGLLRPFSVQMHEWCGPWGEDNCGKSAPNENCAECAHFIKGECEPDPDKRKSITTSKSDKDLASMIHGNKTYSYTCERSIEIQWKNYKKAYKELSKAIDDSIILIKEKNSKQDLLEKKKKQLEMECERLAGTNYDENEVANYLDTLALPILEQEEDLKRYYKSPKYYLANQHVRKSIELAADLKRKMDFYYTMGFVKSSKNADQATGSNANNRSEIIISGMKQMQNACILDASRLYELIRNEVSDPVNETAIKIAVKHLKDND